MNINELNKINHTTYNATRVATREATENAIVNAASDTTWSVIEEFLEEL